MVNRSHSRTKVNHQIELLRKYYPVDEEAKTVTIALRYDSVDELISKDVSTIDHPQIQSAILNRLGDLIALIPIDYKVIFRLSVRDYGPYKADVLLNALNDGVSFAQYQGLRENKRKWFFATLLMVVGILILFFMGVAAMNHWLGEEGSTANSLIKEILDIAGWVFIWESVTLMFLEPSESLSLSMLLKARVSSIGFYHPDSEEPLCKEDQKEILHLFENEKQFKKIGSGLLLFSGGAFLAIAFSGVLSFISEVIVREGETALPLKTIVLLSLLVAVAAVTYLTSGIAGISRYLGKGKLGKWVFPLSIINAAMSIVALIVASINQNSRFIVGVGFAIVVAILYFLGYFLDLLEKKDLTLEDFLRRTENHDK